MPSAKRRLAKAAATAVLLAMSVLVLAEDFELGRGSRCRWGRLRHDNTWGITPKGDLVLIEQLRQNTNIDLAFDLGVPDINNLEQMCQYPFIFMNGEVGVSMTDRQRANLREYALRGGFIFIDDCILTVAQPDLFFVGMTRELTRMFPGARFVDFNQDKTHEIFRVPFRLPGGIPHPKGRNHGLVGVFDKDRLIAVLSASDLHCSWGGYFGDNYQQQALKLSVNLYVYAMNH